VPCRRACRRRGGHGHNGCRRQRQRGKPGADDPPKGAPFGAGRSTLIAATLRANNAADLSVGDIACSLSSTSGSWPHCSQGSVRAGVTVLGRLRWPVQGLHVGGLPSSLGAEHGPPGWAPPRHLVHASARSSPIQGGTVPAPWSRQSCTRLCWPTSLMRRENLLVGVPTSVTKPPASTRRRNSSARPRLVPRWRLRSGRQNAFATHALIGAKAPRRACPGKDSSAKSAWPALHSVSGLHSANRPAPTLVKEPASVRGGRDIRRRSNCRRRYDGSGALKTASSGQPVLSAPAS